MNQSQVTDFSTELKQTDFQIHGLPHQSKIFLVSWYRSFTQKKVGIVL